MVVVGPKMKEECSGLRILPNFDSHAMDDSFLSLPNLHSDTNTAQTRQTTGMRQADNSYLEHEGDSMGSTCV
jgi:hypothetical protein